jgi:hypothetical protein
MDDWELLKPIVDISNKKKLKISIILNLSYSRFDLDPVLQSQLVDVFNGCFLSVPKWMMSPSDFTFFSLAKNKHRQDPASIMKAADQKTRNMEITNSRCLLVKPI